MSIMAVPKILLFVTFFLSPLTDACNFPDVLKHIETTNESKSYETVPELISFTMHVPRMHQGWRLSGASFHENGNNIPMREHDVSQTQGSEIVSFEFSLVPETIENSTVSVVYTPPSNSKASFDSCLFIQKVGYGI